MFTPIKRLGALTSVFAGLLLVSAIASADSTAKPFLDPLFSDNSVLQRGQQDAIWGWTSPQATVRISITGPGGFTGDATGKADDQGKWTANLPKLPVGGPYSLVITGPTQTVTMTNVLSGDVWVCSGQSNMEFGVGFLLNPDQEIDAANYPQIRLLTVPKVTADTPQDIEQGTWSVCTPDNLRSQGTWSGFTAVGYFFGRDLYQNLNVPIGLVQSSWGGTVAEAWTNAKELGDNLPEFQLNLQTLSDAAHGAESHDKQMLDFYAANDPDENKLSAAAVDSTAWPTMNLPTDWQVANIPDLVKFNGIVWFTREFDLTAEQAAKPLVLHFVADDDDSTWVNGVYQGATEGWTTPRVYTLSPSILKAGPNIVTIRVLDTGGYGGIYGDPSTLYIDVPGESHISLVGAWKYHVGKPLQQLTAVPQTVAGNPNFPTVLYNGMIAPLLGYGIKGAIWYQGESNAGRAWQYRKLLPTMIRSWRDTWHQGDFPFLIVQLAGFGDPPTQPGDDAWAELREAQWFTAQTVPNAGIATAIDVGEMHDIHPKNKQEVGRRLALVAEKQVYHEDVDDSGPVYRSMKVEGASIRIHFDHVDGGLVVKGDALTGFQIAGADHKWAWGTATVDGDAVVVTSPQVPSPVAVRYAWSSFANVDLYNKDGLPAFPFRTDEWPAVTLGAK